MKKRTVGFVLALIMVFSLCSTLTCYADGVPDNATEIVVVENGDTLYSLCQKNGFYYSTYKELLMRLNDISDESKLAKISAGTKLAIPTSKAAADALCEALKIDTAKKSDTKKEYKAFDVVGDASKIPAGDKAAYYLVSYTMQKGETVSDLLKSWGMDFKSCSEQILKLNNLHDFNHIAAGKALYIPVDKIELTNDKTYTVIEHIVKSGDTAYTISKAYGMDYNKALPTLELLNPDTDFTRIKVGQKIYIPVNGFVFLGTEKSADSGEVVKDFGVVVSCNDMIRIKRENIRQDLGLYIADGAIPTDYAPKAGDYVCFAYTVNDNTLVYINYIYNVLE